MVAPRSWPVAVGCRSGSRWSARSRAAARTTDLDPRGPGGRLTGRGKAGSAGPGAVGTGRVSGEPRSSLYRLLGGRTRSDGRGFAPVAQFSGGPSMRPEVLRRLPERRAGRGGASTRSPRPAGGGGRPGRSWARAGGRKRVGGGKRGDLGGR